MGSSIGNKSYAGSDKNERKVKKLEGKLSQKDARIRLILHKTYCITS
jgi:hypothetical protein